MLLIKSNQMQISPYVYPGILDASKYKTISDKTIIFERVVDAVCTTMGVTASQLISRRRYRHLVIARSMLSNILRVKYMYTLKSIGILLGRRHHTTILHAITIHEDLIYTNSENYRVLYSKTIEKLRK